MLFRWITAHTHIKRLQKNIYDRTGGEYRIDAIPHMLPLGFTITIINGEFGTDIVDVFLLHIKADEDTAKNWYVIELLNREVSGVNSINIMCLMSQYLIKYDNVTVVTKLGKYIGEENNVNPE